MQRQVIQVVQRTFLAPNDDVLLPQLHSAARSATRSSCLRTFGANNYSRGNKPTDVTHPTGSYVVRSDYATNVARRWLRSAPKS